MKKEIFLVLPLILACLPLFSQNQPKINGYISFSYLKGQDESSWPQGSFENLWAGILFSGELAPNFQYSLETKLREGRIEVEQAFLSFSSTDVFSLKAGLYLVPFGKYNQSNRPHQTPFIEPPLNLGRAYPPSWRDIGLLAEGRIGFLAYSTYLGNGLAEKEELSKGQQFGDNNSDKGKGLRLSAFLSRSFEAGLSYYLGKQDEKNERQLVLKGADVSWQAGELRLLYEYVQATIENPSPFSSGKMEGHFLLLSLNFRRLQPALSYQKLTYSDPFHGPGFTAEANPGKGIEEGKGRWAFSLVFALSQGLLIKFEYDWNEEKNLILKDNLFSAQVALNF